MWVEVKDVQSADQADATEALEGCVRRHRRGSRARAEYITYLRLVVGYGADDAARMLVRGLLGTRAGKSCQSARLHEKRGRQVIDSIRMI